MDKTQVAKKRGLSPAAPLDGTGKMQKTVHKEVLETRNVTAVFGIAENNSDTSSESEESVEAEPYHFANLGERQMSVLVTEFMTDTMILVGGKAIKCHWLMLSCASPKLAALLREREPRLPDVDPHYFFLLLKIIYAGTCRPQNVDTMLQVGRVAQELEVYAAVVFCASSLAKKLNAENLWRILDFANLIEDGNLERACMKLICCEAGTILQTEGFLKCNLATLKMILQQKTLYNVTELQLFQACVAWANSDENRRADLGSALRLLRFLTFTTEDFAKHVSPTGLLSAEDERDIFRSFVTGENSMPEGFSRSTSLRNPVGEIMNIDLGSSHDRNLLGEFPKNTSTSLVFSTVKNIFIVGVKLRAWRANLPVGGLYDENVVVSLQQKIPRKGFPTKITFREKVKKGDMFSVNFNHPMEIACKTIHTLRVAYTQSNRENLTYDLYKQDQSVSQRARRRIHVLNEFLAPPNVQLIVADKVTV